MLIKCPECKNEISDKSEICVHCGYPIRLLKSENLSNICVVDGIPRDMTELIDNMENPNYKPLHKLGKEYNMETKDAIILYKIIRNTNSIPKEYNSYERELYLSQLNENSLKEKANIPKCPTCGSTNIQKISVGKKAFGGAVFGIFSSDIRNTMHCKNCGYKW